MKIIADTNIFLAVALNEPEKKDIIRFTAGSDILSPEVLPYEIGNALSAMVKRKRITQKEAMAAQAAAALIPVQLVDINISRALEIALHFNIYAYDAYFLHVAQAFSCPLMTLDKRMMQVAHEMNIEIME
ncbi:MAG: PIN domain-containing protein [Candidatus Electrothrix sp. AS4_5]|nr:PIN domain-containing protein [Candidatus Electrothrix gigas]